MSSGKWEGSYVCDGTQKVTLLFLSALVHSFSKHPILSYVKHDHLSKSMLLLIPAQRFISTERLH